MVRCDVCTECPPKKVRFFIKFIIFPKLKWDTPNIYRFYIIEVPQKNLRKISNVKFFTVEPYFGCIFKMGPAKMAKNGTFGHF